ncbi:RagB/SusD family nutrient uptake outer membrane protein [Gallalistipes aquisgranensis]|uniref:RagB/SusD family nutrient uptake outer membrane protein n=1 Tax=Gallalistipes aquisgranensis TaxID=2779358 RepID=UPI001CF876F8|nr:RagB/SusD family nutrient uptake outer membrane protein [Gallalistipes aquisgranensis]MBE5033406.1 RagB/SusD family nutrient uptake outer membrane protein [Gallalistipes aquisgranensis]
MKTNHKKYWIAGVALLVFSSCGDFLSKNATNQVFVTSIEDVNELILGEGYMDATRPSRSATLSATHVQGIAIGGWIHVMDDDSKENGWMSARLSYNYWISGLGPFHGWQMDPFIGSTPPFVPYDDRCWSRLYDFINSMNVIIFELDENYAGERRYPALKGEALFLRALYYYYLVNVYAVPYRVSSASTDPGVPIKLSEMVEDKNYSRNSVASVYETIVTDLKEAVRLLDGVTQESIYRPNQTAARLLLSRVYLYMSKYAECVEQCDEILRAGGYSLLDYTTLGAEDDRISFDSPETIFSNGQYRIETIFRSKSVKTGGTSTGSYPQMGNGFNFKASDALIAAFDQENDTRFGIFEKIDRSSLSQHPVIGYYPTFKCYDNTKRPISDCCLFRWPEVLLNKAEALALQGGSDNESEAASTISSLRAKRFVASYNSTVTATGDDLIRLIRDERRRELCFEGHRWFDLRRYAVNERLPYDEPIHHAYDREPENAVDGIPEGYYILPRFSESENGGNWVFSIPQSEILINNGALKDNNRTGVEMHVGMEDF